MMVGPCFARHPVPMLAIFILAQTLGASATEARPAQSHILAVRTSIPPVIDGRLDDDAWRAALASRTFTQHFPDEGAPPSEPTEVRVLYDDDALYVGIDCTQVHSP